MAKRPQGRNAFRSSAARENGANGEIVIWREVVAATAGQRRVTDQRPEEFPLLLEQKVEKEEREEREEPFS